MSGDLRSSSLQLARALMSYHRIVGRRYYLSKATFPRFGLNLSKFDSLPSPTCPLNDQPETFYPDRFP